MTSFATEMQRKFLYTLILSWVALSAGAQKGIYICMPSACEVFDIRHVSKVTFTDVSVNVGTWPSYNVQDVDSIMFRKPSAMDAVERGWWGGQEDEPLHYRMRLVSTEMGFDHEVSFDVTISDGVCVAASCTIFADSEADALQLLAVIRKEPSENAPYIYVKQTKTGTRLYEEWRMNNTQIIPYDSPLQVCGNQLVADLTGNLGQRTLDEVTAIIESWAQQEPTVILQ